MGDVSRFGLLILLTSLAALLAVLSHRLSEKTSVPAPALFLIGSATAVTVFPDLGALSTTAVQRIVTVSLAVILFDGGMHLGWRRVRATLGAILGLGVVGTLLTAAAIAALAYSVLGIDARLALLLGTALAPTDPAVVFSVLGRRDIEGRTDTMLEGESGANDPVGIALMVSLLAAGTGGVLHTASSTAREFALQMVIGAAVGLGGGLLLRAAMRTAGLPNSGLYALRALAGALTVFGAATVAHGSGFLAVFVAGIVLGDSDIVHKREVVRFHSALASLGEIVAFVALGLTIDLRGLLADGSWQVGLVIAVVLTFVIRPAVVGTLLIPVRLSWGERAFVAWAGLKGAVPVLLGTFLLTAGVDGAEKGYHVVLVVVAFSVIVQGGLVPVAARIFGVAMTVREPD
jgi:cell volume regulation protein A